MRKKILSCFIVLLVACTVHAQTINPAPKKQVQKKLPVKKPSVKPAAPLASSKSKTVTTKSKTTISSTSPKPFTKETSSINGQWRGYFDSEGDIVLSGGDNTEYVLELEINGNEVSGYSYTYFENRKYYVICSLSGIYYESTNSLKVSETARIKGLTPPNWDDCLQTHILSYEKEGNKETLKGRWLTAPGQTSNCGTGSTTLTRRTLSKDLASFNKPKTGTTFLNPKPTSKFPDFSDKNKRSAPVASNTPRPKKQTPLLTPEKKSVIKDEPNTNMQTEEKGQTETPVAHDIDFEKRNNDVIKTIEIKNENFRVDLYDNGYIDGDSISLFYNGKLLLSHKRLSDKPISFTLDASTDKSINELTMYAENLGEIPPNTALMVITDGNNRYEARIASDLQKSGTVRFIHNSKKE